MESLRPDRDDLDQFKSRKKPNTGAAAGKPGQKPAKTKQPSNNSPMMFIFVIALAGLSIFLTWAYIDQQSQMEKLNAELKDAAGFIGQSKLLMARLEGELSETDAQLEQSGSAAQSKLAFLDSEMRKLWGVSNDRNKKAIESNANALAALEKKFAELNKQQVKFADTVQARQLVQQTALDVVKSDIGDFESKVDKLNNRILTIANEAVITRDEQEGALDEIKRDLEQIRGLAGKLEESDKALASIDASRRQLNERVVSIERKLNSLQLNFKASPDGADVQ